MGCFSLELRRALASKRTLLCLLVGICLVLLHFIMIVLPYAVDDVWSYWREGYKNVYPISFFNSWFGATGYSLPTVLFFLFLPLLACAPYGWSLNWDARSRYAENIVIRSGRRKYYASKLMAVFLSGGLVVLVPLIFALCLDAAFLPLLTPEITSSLFPVQANGMFAFEYYNYPLLFVACYLALGFVTAGLIGCLSIPLTLFLKNSLLIVIVPFLVSFAALFFLNDQLLRAANPVIYLAPYQPELVGLQSVVMASSALVFIVVTGTAVAERTDFLSVK